VVFQNFVAAQDEREFVLKVMERETAALGVALETVDVGDQPIAPVPEDRSKESGNITVGRASFLHRQAPNWSASTF
jgi:hypothetical protein